MYLFYFLSCHVMSRYSFMTAEYFCNSATFFSSSSFFFVKKSLIQIKKFYLPAARRVLTWMKKREWKENVKFDFSTLNDSTILLRRAKTRRTRPRTSKESISAWLSIFDASFPKDADLEFCHSSKFINNKQRFFILNIYLDFLLIK